MNQQHELSLKEKQDLQELSNLFERTPLEVRNAIYWFIQGTMSKQKITAPPIQSESKLA